MRVIPVAIFVLAVFGRHSFGATIVAPNDREALEGNTSGYAGESRIDFQTLFTPANFREPMRINAIAFRLNAGSGGFSFDTVIPNVTVNLSTYSGNLGSFSRFYASNRGPDDMEVFTGSVAWHSQDLPGGVPNPFELAITFSRSFDYSPALGSLLMRISVPTAGSNDSFASDAHNHNNAGIGWTAMEGDLPLLMNHVILFDYSVIPEAGAWQMLLLGIGVIAFRRRAHFT